jgi:hypothetical protein
MLNGLDEALNERIKVLGEIERNKLRVARGYNKRVKEKIVSGQRAHLKDDFAYRIKN